MLYEAVAENPAQTLAKSNHHLTDNSQLRKLPNALSTPDGATVILWVHFVSGLLRTTGFGETGPVLIRDDKDDIGSFPDSSTAARCVSATVGGINCPSYS